MKTIGFPISHKENEHRRALLPSDIARISHPECLYFEDGYGEACGFTNEDYLSTGANIASRAEVLKKSVLCDPKIGDAEYLESLNKQTVFGWIHAVQNRDITDKLVNNSLTAYAWEDMFEGGRHVFWRNNELAGEAAVLHAFQCYGKMPYETKVAVIGRGNTARGAIKILNMLGADIMVYDRTTEKLLREEIGNYDAIINCVLWDVRRRDHIIYKEDLLKMKRDSIIVDVSCDRNGAIETSIPTTLDAPTYVVDKVLHYAVDHTPTIFHKTFTKNNSKILVNYINELIEENIGTVLSAAKIVENGTILDERINKFQNR